MYILIILLIIIVSIIVFFQVYPPFGGKTPLVRKERSTHFVGGKFINQIPTSMHMSAHDMISIMRDRLRPHSHRKPSQPLVPKRFDTSANMTSSGAQITWFGHSAFLLQVGGKNILLDPMFGTTASPFQSIGPKRFSKQLPAQPEQLPPIDAVLLSHDHYDHLDYGSIKKLAHKTKMFFVPIGLAAHLQKWGVSAEQITELDWWEEATFDEFSFTCTPSRHFSGRTLTDRFTTLWCSWVISSKQTNVYFSGDTGYGPHFKQIGTAYGPFDLTLLECGQYDTRWPDVHMSPEQTVKAHLDLKGSRMIPIHWGAFELALHSWTDPIERVLVAGTKAGATIMTPEIGEVVAFKSRIYPTNTWWKN